MPPRDCATPFLALALLVLAALPARAGNFIDAAGRLVVLPDPITRILPADRNAEVLVFVLAPDKLAGLSRLPGRAGLLPGAGRLPVLAWRPRSTPEHMVEMARRVRANLILDAGPVNPDGVAFANAVQQQTGIPYVLVDSSLTRTPAVLRSLGANLGAGDRAVDLAIFAEHAIAGLRGRLLIRPAGSRPHVYYARGRDGLTTALPGSPAGEAIDEAGAINVAGQLGRGGEVAVSREQLFGWDPEIILAEEKSAYDAFLRSPQWRRLKAVRNKRVYLEPTSPFGWIQDPSGINRLIGLYWLSTLFYPDNTQEDLRAVTCEFYGKFYEITLTNAEIEAMVRPAGAPPQETLRPIGEPLVGLGAAPPSTLPSGPAPDAPAVPGSPTYPQIAPPPAVAGVPGAGCTVPGGPSPYINPTEPASPGVPPPSRRGHPAARLPLETNPPVAGFVPPPMPEPLLPAPATGSGTARAPDTGLPPSPYQYQTRP